MTNHNRFLVRFGLFGIGLLFLLVMSFVITSFGGKFRFVDCPFCLEKFSKEPKDKWVWIYPGLVGCGKKCPLALEALRSFKERFPEIQSSFYFLVTDPSESEEAINSYLAYYQKSIEIKSLKPDSEVEIGFYRKLGAYMPIHPSLKQRDEHGTQFFLVPPNRKIMYLIPKLGEKEWLEIQKEIKSNVH